MLQQQNVLVLSTKRLVALAKILVAATKILSFVPNFVAVTKPFFPCGGLSRAAANGYGIHCLPTRRVALVSLSTREKNVFVTATKLGTTNTFFVPATKNFAAATKRFDDRTKHFVVVTIFFLLSLF